MAVEVTEASEGDRTVLRRLLQFYHYDFSEFDGADVDSHGEYFHRYFDHYWTVRQLPSNPAATAFWRKAIPYPFRESVEGGEITQAFTVSPRSEQG